MFSHILVFMLGIGTGVGLLVANRRTVENAVNKAVAAEKNRQQQTIDRLKRENAQAWKEREQLLRERDWNDGYTEGRKSPLSDVEKLANTLERRNSKTSASINSGR